MNKLLLPVFLFCVAALSLISCTSDDEVQLPNVEAKEMRFIQLDDLPSWSDFGKNNKKGDAYMEALTRIVDFDGQHVSLRYKSAEEARVSQNLYDDIVELYSDYSSFNHIETRGGADKPKTDCVASSISAVWVEMFPELSSYKDSIKTKAWNLICQLYDDQGVPYDKAGYNMMLILSRFFYAASKVDSTNYEFYYDNRHEDERICEARIAIVAISETDYHCMTVIRSTKKTFYCRDDQNGDRPRFFAAADVKAVFRVSDPKKPMEIY